MFWVTQAEEEVGLGRRIADSVQEGSPEYSSDYDAATGHEKIHRIRKQSSLVSHSNPAVPDSIWHLRLSVKPESKSLLVVHVILVTQSRDWDCDWDCDWDLEQNVANLSSQVHVIVLQLHFLHIILGKTQTLKKTLKKTKKDIITWNGRNVVTLFCIYSISATNSSFCKIFTKEWGNYIYISQGDFFSGFIYIERET